MQSNMIKNHFSTISNHFSVLGPLIEQILTSVMQKVKLLKKVSSPNIHAFAWLVGFMACNFILKTLLIFFC